MDGSSFSCIGWVRRSAGMSFTSSLVQSPRVEYSGKKAPPQKKTKATIYGRGGFDWHIIPPPEIINPSAGHVQYGVAVELNELIWHPKTILSQSLRVTLCQNTIPRNADRGRGLMTAFGRPRKKKHRKSGSCKLPVRTSNNC
jgi:hypothetical protein